MVLLSRFGVTLGASWPICVALTLLGACTAQGAPSPHQDSQAPADATDAALLDGGPDDAGEDAAGSDMSPPDDTAGGPIRGNSPSLVASASVATSSRHRLVFNLAGPAPAAPMSRSRAYRLTGAMSSVIVRPR